MQGYRSVLDLYPSWEQEELAWIDPATGQPIATVEDERSRPAREREARIEQLEAHIEEREARAAAERRQLTGDIRHTPGLRLRERRRPMGGRCRRAEHQPVLPGGAKRHPKRHRDPRTGTQRPPYLQHQGEPRTGEPPGHQRLLQHRHLQHPLFNVNYFCRLASIILAGSPPYPAPAAGPLRSGSWGHRIPGSPSGGPPGRWPPPWPWGWRRCAPTGRRPGWR